MGLNINLAVRHAEDNAEDDPQHECATYVREALEAGGLDLTHHPVRAKDYGPTLEANGFQKIYEFKPIPPVDYDSPLARPAAGASQDDLFGMMFGGGALAHTLKWTEFKGVVAIPLMNPQQQVTEAYQPQKGDVVVIQPYPGGNPAGHIAIYTGTQWISDFRQRDIWGGSGYRKHKPQATVYRSGQAGMAPSLP